MKADRYEQKIFSLIDEYGPILQHLLAEIQLKDEEKGGKNWGTFAFMMDKVNEEVKELQDEIDLLSAFPNLERHEYVQAMRNSFTEALHVAIAALGVADICRETLEGSFC